PLELGEKAGQRTFVLDRGAARHVQRDAHLLRQDACEGCLPEARRPAEENMIERLAPAACGLDKYLEVLLVLALADVLVERGRPEEAVEAVLIAELDGREHPFRHAHRSSVGGREREDVSRAPGP